MSPNTTPITTTSSSSPPALVSAVKRASETDAYYASRLAVQRKLVARRIADASAKLERDRALLHALEREGSAVETAAAVAAAEALAREQDDRMQAARAVAALAGRDSPSYWTGTGRYQTLYDRLWTTLVPAQGRADTFVGNVLIALTKLYRRLADTGMPPRVFWAERQDTYFRALGVTFDDVALAVAPDDAWDNEQLDTWVEQVLVNVLEEGVPARALPLPETLPAYRHGLEGTRGREWL